MTLPVKHKKLIYRLVRSSHRVLASEDRLILKCYGFSTLLTENSLPEFHAILMQNWNKFILEKRDMTDVNKETKDFGIRLNVESLSAINSYYPDNNICLNSSVFCCFLPQIWVAIVHSKPKTEWRRQVTSASSGFLTNPQGNQAFTSSLSPPVCGTTFNICYHTPNNCPSCLLSLEPPKLIFSP